MTGWQGSMGGRSWRCLNRRRRHLLQFRRLVSIRSFQMRVAHFARQRKGKGEEFDCAFGCFLEGWRGVVLRDSRICVRALRARTSMAQSPLP